MPVIQVQGLTKTFRTYKKEPGFAGALKGLVSRKYETTFAVNNVGFQVEEGELVGFLGPNGAGKTTTLKMLSGLLYPTGGSATVLGYTPWERSDSRAGNSRCCLGRRTSSGGTCRRGSRWS
jgi:ABC-2 type transport system ATP-binding protein